MSDRFPHLFSPLRIRDITIKNRVCSTGHDTSLPTAGVPNDALIAYHRARAQGGVGLIIVQVAGIHESARYTSHILMATNDDCIPGYRQIANACHQYDCKVFGQLFHPGREIMESQDGSTPVAYSASSTPNERFHVMPRRMSKTMIEEVIDGYADGAARLKRAGLDGVELVASHGYLPSQFLNPRINVRDDEYGGSLENRVRFLREIIQRVRDRLGELIVGVRISANEMEHGGLMPAEALDVCTLLDHDGHLDYFNVISGSSATLKGSIHIVPPMAIANAYVAPFAAAIRKEVSKPVIVTGRINQPHEAEQVIASGQADICGMTRAMICDPELANKAQAGRTDDIRVCIGCNQACIGHFHLGYGISCIQHPETGRELEYGARNRTSSPHTVMVVGGGPAGMKAAAVAAECGHRVTLYEKASQLGGQALLAQLLPGRAEFGGIVTNLQREIELAGVEVIKNTEVSKDLVHKKSPDAVILATGARPYIPDVAGADEAHVVDAWQVLKGETKTGNSVVVADWRCDWVGLGMAEKLAREGCHVRLCSNGPMPGYRIQQYVRDHWLGALHKLGVEIIPMVRLAGVDSDTAYFQHTISEEPILCENTDTLVLALGHASVDRLEQDLEGSTFEVIPIGDCLSPRTAEEAVLEGLKAGTALARIEATTIDQVDKRRAL
ncbi:MAG: FAD-dependent oxidoreductase [Acidiferrobacterales bacterium]